ncbi:hypothetical protein ACH41H_37395 [Streptomyces sp. NPDC020800]|uniref:hypothetical protein n=1 Tax=Streptomyces sp. NPDC020800 TaxID=3365092 RepID=UPI00378A650C
MPRILYAGALSPRGYDSIAPGLLHHAQDTARALAALGITRTTTTVRENDAPCFTSPTVLPFTPVEAA